MSASSYIPALAPLGVVEKVGADLGYYQGDYVLVFREEDDYGYSDSDRWGFLTIGYGSCSGCDAWQSADTVAERLAIVTGLVNSIRWFDDLDALKAWLADTKARDLDVWASHEDGWAEFVAQVQAIQP